MNQENIKWKEMNVMDTMKSVADEKKICSPITDNFGGSLYKELKYRCNPERYMEPYDPEKVRIANQLYSQIPIPNENNQVSAKVLKSIRNEAIELLSIKFSTEVLYNRLKKMCYPRIYMNENYDKEKLDIANELYQDVLKYASDIVKLEELETAISEKLYNSKDLEIIEQERQREKDKEEADESTLLMVFVFIVIFIMVIVFIGLSIEK